MAASIGIVLPAFNSSAAEVVLCSVVSCALRWGSAFRSLKCDESGPICQSERVVSWGIDLGGDYAVSAEILRVSAVERAKAISVLVTFAEVAVLNFSIFCYVMPLFLEQPPSICSQKASRQKITVLHILWTYRNFMGPIYFASSFKITRIIEYRTTI